jgi:hypothetical protein
VIREGVLAQHSQEQGAPPVVVVSGAIQNQGHEDLDVEDDDRGGVDGGVLCRRRALGGSGAALWVEARGVISGSERNRNLLVIP